MEFCSVGVSVIKNLEKYGVISIYDKEVLRNPYKNVQITENKDIELSPQQMEAYTTYSNMLDGEGGTGLLFGVYRQRQNTSIFKTY